MCGPGHFWIRVPSRRIPVHFREEVEVQIQQLLEKGIITESSSPWLAPAVYVRKKTGDTYTGVPAVVMRWDASDVVPGVVTNKSLNLSTTVTKHVLIISGNSTLGGDPNFGIAHSSVISWFASSIVSPILATGHFFVLTRRSSVHIGFIGGADSWFALSFEGATVTGVVVKSNTSPCNCRKSVPNITAVIKSFTTTKSWSFSSVPSRTVAFTYPKMGRLYPAAVTSRISCLGCVHTTPVAF